MYIFKETNEGQSNNNNNKKKKKKKEMNNKTRQEQMASILQCTSVRDGFLFSLEIGANSFLPNQHSLFQ